MKTCWLGLLLVLCLPAAATQTGLVYIPSTDVEAYQKWHIDNDAYIYTNGGTIGAFTEQGAVTGIFPRAELGADVVQTFINVHGTKTTPLWFNGKYQLIPTSIRQPFAVALGAYEVSPQASANAEKLYAEGSYTFSGPYAGALAGLRVTAGGYGGNAGVIGHDNKGVLLGLDARSGRWWYATDFQSGKNTVGAWNAGVGYYFTEKLELIVGYDIYNAPAIVGAHSSVNFQVDIDI